MEFGDFLLPNLDQNHDKMFLNFPKILNIFIIEKPTIKISNGNEIAIPFLYVGKLLGIKRLFIEGYSRIDTTTITGKFVDPALNLFFTLWPEILAKNDTKSQHWCGIFDFWNAAASKKDNGDYILLIPGMHSFFDRLMVRSVKN